MAPDGSGVEPQRPGGDGEVLPLQSKPSDSAAHMLSGPLENAKKIEEAKLQDVPTPEALAKWLSDRGCDTSAWGKGDTKDVKKFWKEIQGDESALELWAKPDGQNRPVRVTHVLRAKVCSKESYAAGVFLFNTWQQFADGRKRTRNGLLSEKLAVSELPLEDNLQSVCARAIDEEMMRVVDASCVLRKDEPGPVYNKDEPSPLTVQQARFVNHTVEVDESKSFPGLLTMYHLYTVEVECSGLPNTDFNTLEFNPADAQGERKLKYLHAWVWLEWTQIQRYLFEGSVLKERLGKGSFESPEKCAAWLSQFRLDLSAWGQDGLRTVQDLFDELETEEAHLELWGRHDGTPLLMRVTHVLQARVRLADDRMSGKFLLQVWQQSKDGTFRSGVNRLLARKLSAAHVPFNETHFEEGVLNALHTKLGHTMDGHYQMRAGMLPTPEDCTKSSVSIKRIRFVDHRHEVEDSSAFKGLFTLYHLYTFDVLCEGLPLTTFTSIDFKTGSGPWACGWCWVTWLQTMDMLQQHAQGLRKREETRSGRISAAGRMVSDVASSVEALKSKIGAQESERRPAAEEALKRTRALQEEWAGLQEVCSKHNMDGPEEGPVTKLLPPSMVSIMALDTIATASFLESAMMSSSMYSKVHAQGTGLSRWPSIGTDGQPSMYTAQGAVPEWRSRRSFGSSSASGRPQDCSMISEEPSSAKGRGANGSSKGARPQGQDGVAAEEPPAGSSRSRQLQFGIFAAIALLCVVQLAVELALLGGSFDKEAAAVPLLLVTVFIGIATIVAALIQASSTTASRKAGSTPTAEKVPSIEDIVEVEGKAQCPPSLFVGSSSPEKSSPWQRQDSMDDWSI